MNALNKGQQYDVTEAFLETLDFINASGEKASEVEIGGYSMLEYFDDDGIYQGPDDYGVSLGTV